MNTKTKVLITSKNSPNGIVQKIIGSNVYENILSFDTPLLKDNFINKFYFNEGEDYKALLLTKTDKPFKIISDTTATIIVDSSEYPNETRMSLINKDTAVILEDGNYYWYALKNPNYTSNNTISYDAELDIFLTYDIKDINMQGQAPIIRAHTDRYDNTEKHIAKDNYYYEEDLEFAKPVETKTNYPLIPTYNGDSDDIDKSRYVSWMVFYVSTTDGNGVIWDRHFDGSSQFGATTSRFPFKIYIAPQGVISLGGNSGTLGKHVFEYKDTNSTTKIFGDGTYDFFKNKDVENGERTISIHYTKGFPFTLSIFDEIKVNSPNITYTGLNSSNLSEQAKWDSDSNSIEILDIQDFIQNSNNVKFQDIELNKPIITSYNNPREINNESKLFFSQFSKYSIISNEGIGESSNREFLTNATDSSSLSGLTDTSKIKIRYRFGFQAEVLSELFFVANESLVDNEFEKIGFIKVGINEFPINTKAYEEYENQNRISSKTGYLGGAGVKTISGAATGGVGGAVVGGPVGALIGAGIGAATGAASGIAGGIKHAINMADLKKTPNTVSAVSNQYGIQLGLRKPIYLSHLFLPELQLQTTYDYLYSNGYFLRKLDSLSNWINTRYYFNYIKTGSIFNNITAQLSPEIKQIISDTLQTGVRIWHVRDLNTYKGLLNYEFENQEMNLI